MSDFRIEVSWCGGLDGRALELQEQITQLGLARVRKVQISNLYFLRGDLTPADVERVAASLLTDPIVERYWWEALAGADSPPDPGGDDTTEGHVIEVGFHPGVTDPVAIHLLHRASDIGICGLEAVTTATRYTLEGRVGPAALHRIAQELLCNDVIQSYTLGRIDPEFVPAAAPSDIVETVPLRMLDAQELADLSVSRVLFLSLPEMQAIQAEFRRLGRDPTDVELETLAQTWSEHCLHKAFRATIRYRCEGGVARYLPGRPPVPSRGEEEIHGLLRSYLRRATEAVAKPWVRSAFVDNAGVIDFDGTYELAFKVETHNHPSALEPFGGANTGVGGVIRDVIGVSARPIADTDVLCFAPQNVPAAEVPLGTLHPRRVARGVVAGIEDYGNKMGIPTVSGAILFDEDYVANPLVYCGCVGIAPQGKHRREPRPSDCIVLLGGKTGRDGLHGATFSSAELTHETGTTVGSVVQIGDPITEKAVLDAIIQIRDDELYTAITDCGAGGLSSAVGEMGHEVGVDVDLQDVPLKYPGLHPWEIWLSEAQERMVIAAPERNLARIGQICGVYDVEWTVIGRFTGDRRLHIRYGDKTVADLSMAFLHGGWPRPTMQAIWSPPEIGQAELVREAALPELLLRALSHPDIASKEDVIRRYDHEVQGATVARPLVGTLDDGHADAAVLKPLMTAGRRGLALGCGVNPHYGRLDPYAMAWAVIDEAIRNVVAVGADPDRVALLDNFCWGNPALPDRLGGLVRAAQGCHDAAIAYGAPFISGKDSLNNEFVDARGDKRTIPPTLLISSLAIVPDVEKIITMDLKEVGNPVYLLGETRSELGGSLYQRLCGVLGGNPPLPVPEALTAYRVLHRLIQDGGVRAVHDLSEGGLAVAAAEMCIGGRIGLNLSLPTMPRAPDVLDDTTALFAESSARFIIEVPAREAAAFEAAMDGLPCRRVGTVARQRRLTIRGLDNRIVIDIPVDELVATWKSAEIV